MNTEHLKKELHKLIDNTDDEVLLSMVKDELVVYQRKGRIDNFSDLCKEDRAEMEELANEDPMKDTITLEEFQQHMAEWRIKLLQKRDSKIK